MGVFLESIGLNDSKDSEEDEQENAVQFMTLHTSKGLEFESVFLISVNEEIVPHKNSILEDRIDEERRLFFVGVTRAKRILSISFTNRTFSGLCFPSRFLKEVGALEQIKSSNRYGKQIAYQDTNHLPEDSIAYKLENNEYEPETSFDLTVGDLVKHDKFGRGVVKEVKPSGIVKVGFSEGDRVLSLAFAKLERLIDAT
jgi:ATP-dependent exoDNAse (exonuclease V) beta subunit